MNGKQFFMAGKPVQRLLNKISKHKIHFLLKDPHGNVLMANDMQAGFYGFSSMDSFIGQNIYELLPNSEVGEAIINDKDVIKNSMPQLFHETCLDKECMSIKSQLHDSANNVVGVGAVDFYFNQINLKDIVSLIKELFFESGVVDNVASGYVFNTRRLNMLSMRERECVRYLTVGMNFKEIANKLDISHRTVEKHIESVKTKLGCYRRSDVVGKIFGE